VDQGGVAQVVQATLAEDGGAGLEPDTVGRECDGAGAAQQLRHEAPKGAEHGPASMDDLSLAQTSEGLRVSRQAHGVPAIVT
jgi:hypothetical protein